MIKIYDKYIFMQVLMATLVAIILFTVIWIAPEMLLNTIKRTIEGVYTPQVAVMVLVCELPKILGKAFPVGLLLGTLFTFDKLSKDFELTIFRAAGMSFARIIAPVVVLSVIVTYLCFITYDKLIPYSCNKLNEIKGANPVSQFVYIQKDVDKHPLAGIIVSRYNRDSMENIIVLDFADKVYSDMHPLTNIHVAETGYIKDNKWTLKDVTSYAISTDGIFEEISKSDTFVILKGVEAENAKILMDYSTKRDREIDNADLKKYINLLKSENLDEEYRLNANKYYQRFIHPLVCILLALMGCILGFSRPRERSLVGFVIAIGCVFIYYITLPFFDLLAEKGVLPPLIAASFSPILFAIATYKFYQAKELASDTVPLCTKLKLFFNKFKRCSN